MIFAQHRSPALSRIDKRSNPMWRILAVLTLILNGMLAEGLSCGRFAYCVS